MAIYEVELKDGRKIKVQASPVDVSYTTTRQAVFQAVVNKGIDAWHQVVDWEWCDEQDFDGHG